VEAARAELLRLGTPTTRPAAPAVKAAAPKAPRAGEALLATWHELLDAGRMQDGDEHLAGTAKPVRARISKQTAADVGVADGEPLSISTEQGALVLPVAIDDLPDGVVWLPTNARGCAVRATLGATSGSVVKLVRTDAPPVIGEAS
jgi:NADH-quinone oxidoreductase subunit G